MKKTPQTFNNLWIFVVLVLSGLAYWTARTNVYVEGDDATSIAFHLLGRNKNMQPAYSPYQGMADKVLGILPAREPLLRSASQDATRLAAIAMIVLIMSLVFDWAGQAKVSGTRKVLVTFAVLLAVPEFYYFGLVYSPTLVAMALVLSAHLVVRRLFTDVPILKTTRTAVYFVASLILFSLGVAFRWNIIVYGAVIVVDWLVNRPKTNPPASGPNPAVPTILWGGLAVLLSAMLVELSGYGYLDFISEIRTVLFVANQAGTSHLTAVSSLRETLTQTILTLTPVLTPGFVLLFLLGLLKVVRDRNPLGWVVLISLLGILPWALSGVPKFLVTAFPALIYCFVAGFGLVWDYVGPKRYALVSYIMVFLVLLAPWVIGVRVTRAGTAWGPGFELRPYDYSDVQGTKLHLTLGSGTAFPTPEGPRPLYGHAYVLLGGGWNSFIDGAAAERQKSIDTAVSLKAPLVVTSWSPDYYLDDLYAMGYTTADPYNRTGPDGYFRTRSFVRLHAGTVELLYHEVQGADILKDLQSYSALANSNGKIVFVGYSQTLRALYENHPGALSALGPNSAVIDLVGLHSQINSPSGNTLAIVSPFSGVGYPTHP